MRNRDSVIGFIPIIMSLPATVRVPSSTRRPAGSVTVISFPISIGVISTVIVTALGATFSVAPAIGEVATKELAKAGEAMKKVRPITPTSAAIRFKVKPAFPQFATMVSLP